MYSQKSYPKVKLGTCSDTISQSGCFLVSLCNLTDRDPEEVNKLFTTEGGYVNGCLMNADKAAELLGLKYLGKKSTAPKFTCLAETDHYKYVGVPQHFFLWEPDGLIVDPLDKNPDWKENPYKIVSYRLFEKIDAGEGVNPPVVSNDLETENASLRADIAQLDAIVEQCEKDLEACKLQFINLPIYTKPEDLTINELISLIFKKIWPK